MDLIQFPEKTREEQPIHVTVYLKDGTSMKVASQGIEVTDAMVTLVEMDETVHWIPLASIQRLEAIE